MIDLKSGNSGYGVESEASVCAIVIYYFGAELSRNCITSLATEGLQKILLVDNSASDEQRNSLADIVYETQINHADLLIEVINSDENLGFGRAVNAAIVKNEASGFQPSYYL